MTRTGNKAAGRDLKGKRVLIVGLGKSGLAAARVLAARGANVLVNDAREAEALGARAEEARAFGAELILGGHPEERFLDVDQIVVSPGVPPLPALSAAEAAGVPIASEVELASWFVNATVIAITGTNGKSTVTTLVGEMCARSGRPTFVGGNLGTPLIDVVGTDAAGEKGLVVAELSSFQLERVDRFRADIAVLLNVSPDHLDRYDYYADYAIAKGNVFNRQRAQDVAVIAAGDHLGAALAGRGAATARRFGAADDVHVEGDHIVSREGLHFPLASLRIAGRHNVENACAAACAALAAGVTVSNVERALAEFGGLPHRMEHVRELDGVTYFDDSKATNVGAAVAALEGLRGAGGRSVLIAGGRHKGSSYAPLARAMKDLGRAAVLVGESSAQIEASLAGVVPCERTGDLSEAVSRARELAEPGDFVVLAPACSSFDMFRSYAERGDVFQRAVKELR